MSRRRPTRQRGKPTRAQRLLAACDGNVEQVQAVERLLEDAIRAGGGLLLGRRRMPA